MTLRVLFDLSWLQLLALGLVAGTLAFLMYRKLEGITPSRKFMLASLRGLTLFILLLAAFNLVTNLVRTYEKKRDVYVLVDDSKSMSLKDGEVARDQSVKKILESPTLDSLRRNFDVRLISFGGTAGAVTTIDSLKFDQPSTNIEAAIDEASKLSDDGSAGFAILLSDGNYNSGDNPVHAARSLTYPICAVGIGDSSQPKDVFVRQLIASPTLYAGKSSTLRTIIGSYGFAGRKIPVEFLEDNKEIASRDVVLPDAGDIEVQFQYTPSEIGTHVLTVRAAPQPAEFNRENNSSSATVEVQNGKFSILMVAGEPSTDLAFLRRTIEDNPDFDLKVLVQKSGSEFYENESGAALSRKYDAVALVDFPNGQSAATFNQVTRLLELNNVPYVYFAGKEFSSTAVRNLVRLPFTFTRFEEGEFQIGISPAAASSVPLDLQPLISLLTSKCQLLPPLYYQRIDAQPAQGSTALAVPVMNGTKLNSPLFFFNSKQRSAAVLAYGLWRIKLMSPLSGLQADFLDDLVDGILRTLISGGRQKLLTVRPDKKTYDPSEKIQLNAQLIDQTGIPVDDASVDVKVEDALRRRSVADVQLSATGDGGYAGALAGLGEGRYTFAGRASNPNVASSVYGVDSGAIVVEPLRTEFVQTPMNAQVLRQLASATGGQFLTAQEFLENGINVNPDLREPAKSSDTRRFEMLSLLPALAAALVLLSIEWTLRKLSGLP